MPKVSIIMPVYNKENDLQRSIGSVIEQKFQDFELIIVNDGSTDQSDSIIQRIAEQDNRIRVINQSNGGVSKARNSGLAYATGEWIQFLDADDEILPDYLQEAVPIAEENEVDILFSNFIRKAAEEDTYKKINIPIQGIALKEELYDYFMEYQYTVGYFGYISNKLVNANLLKQGSISFRDKLKLAEDLDFFIQLYKSLNKVYFWNGYSFNYIQSINGQSCDINIDYESQLDIHLRIKDWFAKSNNYKKYERKLNVVISQYIYWVVYYGYENRMNINELCRRFYCNNNLMSSLNPMYVRGINFIVIILLKIHCTRGIGLIMQGRSMIRYIYRKIHNFKLLI